MLSIYNVNLHHMLITIIYNIYKSALLKFTLFQKQFNNVIESIVSFVKFLKTNTYFFYIIFVYWAYNVHHLNYNKCHFCLV